MGPLWVSKRAPRLVRVGNALVLKALVSALVLQCFRH